MNTFYGINTNSFITKTYTGDFMKKSKNKKEELLYKIVDKLTKEIIEHKHDWINGSTQGICSRQVVAVLSYLIDKGIIKG